MIHLWSHKVPFVPDLEICLFHSYLTELISLHTQFKIVLSSYIDALQVVREAPNVMPSPEATLVMLTRAGHQRRPTASLHASFRICE